MLALAREQTHHNYWYAATDPTSDLPAETLQHFAPSPDDAQVLVDNILGLVPTSTGGCEGLTAGQECGASLAHSSQSATETGRDSNAKLDSHSYLQLVKQHQDQLEQPLELELQQEQPGQKQEHGNLRKLQQDTNLGGAAAAIDSATTASPDVTPRAAAAGTTANPLFGQPNARSNGFSFDGFNFGFGGLLVGSGLHGMLHATF